MKKGLLIVYSGPSGVGKSSILARLLKDEELNLAFSISMTTRAPRGKEKEGVDYYYVDKETFEEAIENDEFLEYAKYVDNYYGTPKKYVDLQRSEGKNVILEIEVQGGKQVIEKVEDVVSIFILPPSMEILEQRLIGRATDDSEVIKKRLAKAQSEIEESSVYKYHVVNDRIDVAVNEIKEIIKKEMGN